jgi:hypothetical protein
VIELARHVIRIGRLRKVRPVAVPARLEQILELVVYMTLVARNGLMCTDQRERCRRMTERRGFPDRRRVAGGTVVFEVSQHVVRVRRLLEYGLMTLVTVDIRQLVVTADMACHALCADMHTGENKTRGTVIKLCRVPCRCRVTLNAIRTEDTGDMLGIEGIVKVGLVAVDAIGR